MGEINLVVVRSGPNDEPMLAMIQNHTVIYIPAGPEGIRLAQGMVKIIETLESKSKSEKSGIQIVKQ